MEATTLVQKGKMAFNSLFLLLRLCTRRTPRGFVFKRRLDNKLFKTMRKDSLCLQKCQLIQAETIDDNVTNKRRGK